MQEVPYLIYANARHGLAEGDPIFLFYTDSEVPRRGHAGGRQTDALQNFESPRDVGRHRRRRLLFGPIPLIHGQGCHRLQVEGTSVG